MEKGFLSGYRTYITAVFTIVASFLAFALGEEVAGQPVMDLQTLISNAAMSLLAIFLRKGIKSNGGSE